MVSDVLFGAVEDIREYLRSDIYRDVYRDAVRQRLEALVVEMNEIREILDAPPTQLLEAIKDDDEKGRA